MGQRVILVWRVGCIRRHSHEVFLDAIVTNKLTCVNLPLLTIVPDVTNYLDTTHAHDPIGPRSCVSAMVHILCNHSSESSRMRAALPSLGCVVIITPMEHTMNWSGSTSKWTCCQHFVHVGTSQVVEVLQVFMEEGHLGTIRAHTNVPYRLYISRGMSAVRTKSAKHLSQTG